MPSKVSYKVLISEDHPIFALGLKMCIDRWDEFKFVGIAENSSSTMLLCSELLPDIVIMDMDMPILPQTDALRRIKGNHPKVKILALTAICSEEIINTTMLTGCEGFLLKATEPEKLHRALLSVMDGINVYDEKIMEITYSSILNKPGMDFTDRERKILESICRGSTNAEIADKMMLHTGTVKNLISLLLSKTNSVSRSQLATFAIENHIVP